MTQLPKQSHTLIHEHTLEDTTFLNAMLHMNNEHYSISEKQSLESKNFSHEFQKIF